MFLGSSILIQMQDEVLEAHDDVPLLANTQEALASEATELDLGHHGRHRQVLARSLPERSFK